MMWICFFGLCVWLMFWRGCLKMLIIVTIGLYIVHHDSDAKWFMLQTINQIEQEVSRFCEYGN